MPEPKQSNLGMEQTEGLRGDVTDWQMGHAGGVQQGDGRITRIEKNGQCDPTEMRALRGRQPGEALHRIVEERGIGRIATHPAEMAEVVIGSLEMLGQRWPWQLVVVATHGCPSSTSG